MVQNKGIDDDKNKKYSKYERMQDSCFSTSPYVHVRMLCRNFELVPTKIEFFMNFKSY